MKTWKTLIIDDEQLARQRLKRFLKPFEEFDIIGEAVNGADGLEDKLPERFVKILRSTLINTDSIKEIRRGFNGALVFIMNNATGSKLTSSRSNGEMLRERFDI